MEDVAVGFDPQEGVLGGGDVEAGVLGVGEEGVWPPDLGEHLVTDAQLVLHLLREGQPRVVPMLPEVKVHCKVLQYQEKKGGLRDRVLTLSHFISNVLEFSLLSISYQKVLK